MKHSGFDAVSNWITLSHSSNWNFDCVADQTAHTSRWSPNLLLLYLICTNNDLKFIIIYWFPSPSQITLLVNNAGVVSGRALLDTPDHLIERSFNVNVLAHFWVCTQHQTKHFCLMNGSRVECCILHFVSLLCNCSCQTKLLEMIRQKFFQMELGGTNMNRQRHTTNSIIYAQFIVLLCIVGWENITQHVMCTAIITQNVKW